MANGIRVNSKCGHLQTFPRDGRIEFERWFDTCHFCDDHGLNQAWPSNMQRARWALDAKEAK